MREHPDDLFAGTAHYYARYRPPYPEQFFRHVVERFGLDGTGRLLDLGCGTGQLAIPFAPFFAEVVGLDPDPAMLAEAARVAREADVRNARWIQGRDTDLARLSDELSPLRLTTLGRSFHWMNQAETLRALERLTEPAGGVVIAADWERIYHFDGEWQKTVRAVIRHWLGEVRRAGSGTYNVRHLPFEESLAQSAFSRVERYETIVERAPTIDDIVGYLYSTSFCSTEVLGDKRQGFEVDLRQTLESIEPSGQFHETATVDAWLAWRG